MSFVDAGLSRWIQTLSTDITPAGVITRLEIYHAVAGQGGILLDRMQVDESTLALEETAQAVWDICERDANQYESGSIQRYVVLGFRADEEEQHDKRYPFSIRGRGVNRDLMEDSTPPTEQGAMAQMLRHDIEKDRLLTLLIGSTAERQERELARKEKMLERYEERFARTIQLNEELQDRKADRELRQATELRKAKRMDEVAGMVLGLGPMLFAQLMGGKNIGQVDIASKMRDTAIGKILKSLTEQEFISIMNNLKPERQIAFLELYKSYAQEAKTDDDSKPPIMRENAETASAGKTN